MIWPIQPALVQLFVLYLIAVGCATLVRLVRFVLVLSKADSKLNLSYAALSRNANVTRACCVLTILLSAFVFVANVSDVVRGAWAIVSPVEPGTILFRKNLVLALEPLELGLMCSTVLYALSAVQEYVLSKRKAKWDSTFSPE